MPTPSGLKISELPYGLSPASNGDIVAVVQNGNTVQIPVSGIRRNTTAELPESGNLYYTNARARAAFSAGEGLVYTQANGVFTLNPSYISDINTSITSSITGVSVVSNNNGKQKTIYLQKKNGTQLTANWIDQGQDISISASQGLSVQIENNIWNISNSDRGSSQNIFKTVSVSGSQSLIANSNTDYITLIPGSNISIVSNSGNRTITINTTGSSNPVTGIIASTGISVSRVSGEVTISNSDRGSAQNIFKTIAISGQSNVNATGNSDTLNLVAGSNIQFSTDPSTNKIVINAVSGAGLVGNVTSVNGLSGTVILTTDNIPEGAINKYYTDARSRGAFSAGNGISISNGIITNSSPLSTGKIFSRVIVSNPPYSTVAWIDPLNSSDQLTILAGSGISISGNANDRSLVINASGAAGASAGAGGPSGSIQFNRVGSLTGVSSFNYNINTAILSKTDGKLQIGAYSSTTNNTGIITIAGSGQVVPMQVWQDSTGNILSSITNSGCFQGSVTPQAVRTDTDLILNNSHNGKIIEFIALSRAKAILSSGISVSGWNAKVISTNSNQSVDIETESRNNNLLYPSDKFPSTRTGYSLVEIYRRDGGDFVLYGDLSTTSSDGGGGGGGGGVTPPPPAANCTLVDNPAYVQNLQAKNGSTAVKNIYNNTSIYPTDSVFPPITNKNTVLTYAWGSENYNIALNETQIEIKIPADTGCYDYLGVIDQYGTPIQYTLNSPPYLLTLNVTGQIPLSQTLPVYEEVSFNIVTSKTSTAATVTTPIKVAMATNLSANSILGPYSSRLRYWFNPRWGIDNDGPTVNSAARDSGVVASWEPYAPYSYPGSLLSVSPTKSPLIRTGSNGVNGAPYLQFDGSGSAMNLSVTLTNKSNYLIAVAARLNDTASSHHHYLFNINDYDGVYKGYGGGDLGGSMVWRAGNTFKKYRATSNNWAIYLYVVNAGTYRSYWAYNNLNICGAPMVQDEITPYAESLYQLSSSAVTNGDSITTTVANFPSVYNLNKFALGYNPLVNNSNFHGDIGEILIYELPGGRDWYITQDNTNPFSPVCSIVQGSYRNIASTYISTLISNVNSYLSFWTT